MSHHLPTDLGEALALLDRRAGPVVSGGTDFYPALGPGKAPDEIIDISRVEGLSGIVMGADEIRFGATTTWSEIAAAAHLPPAFDALRQAAREVGSIQIQNAGTIAGNLCNASPAADGVPPLMVLGAEVELESAARGRRRLPLAAFVTGVRQVARQPDELVTAVIVPRPDPAARSAFVKLGSRRYLVISIAMAAALVRRAADGTIAEARIAVGACAPVARRLPRLEAAVVGRAPGAVRITPQMVADLVPIDDVRGSAAYRLRAAAELCARAIARAAADE